jgi:hypothetical protein
MNTKDREELLILKNDMSYVKEKVSSVANKLDKFIGCADNKYATKKELADMSEIVKEHKRQSDFGDSNVWRWLGILIPWILMIIVVIIQKMWN